MKIFLPYKTQSIGGTSTFANIFSSELKKRGFKITSNPKRNYDILFVLSDCSLRYVIDAKLKHKKIIQRLDGVYNFAANGWIYPILNIKMRIIHSLLADCIIYQSEFSKLSCEKFLGKTSAKKTLIIYNGVDTNKIKPNKNITHSNKIKLLTFAKFRRRDQIEPLIESVKLLDPRKFSLDIYGSYSNKLQHIFNSLSHNIRFKGAKNNDELLKIINRYDIFIFSDQSACPNSVLEAMAAGLAIVAYERGSIEELVVSGYNGEVTRINTHDQFSDSYPFLGIDYDNFKKSIIKASFNLKEYKKNNVKRVHNYFSINSTIRRYLKIFNKVIANEI